MPRTRRQSNISLETALKEVAAVLTSSPESTNLEICDAINQWLKKRKSELQIKPQDVGEVRRELGIPDSDRKPVQRDLF